MSSSCTVVESISTFRFRGSIEAAKINEKGSCTMISSGSLRVALAFGIAGVGLSACGGGSSGSPPINTSTQNAAPKANAGDDKISSKTGDAITLTGVNSSDPEGQALTYTWTLTKQPTNSSSVLSAASTATPSFTPDIAGKYEVFVEPHTRRAWQ